MTDADRIEALLDILDNTRTESRERSDMLVITGYAERRGKTGVHLTQAGWDLLGDLGRQFEAGRRNAP